MKLRVGIDGACWRNRRGYGRFLRQLLDALATADRANEYTIFFDGAVPGDFTLSERFRPIAVGTSKPADEAASADGSRSLVDLLRMGRAVAREPLDLFFFPSVYSYFPLLKRVRCLLGVHDTIADRNPRFAFASRRHELFWRWKVRAAIAQADTVLTVSEYSRRCIAQHLRVPATRIRVIPEGPAACFRKLESRPTPALSGPYVLYVGGISPNKNLTTLVRAFARLPERECGTKLVLAGDYLGDGFKSSYGELMTLIAELGLGDSVVFPGFVADEELCRLYNGASLFIMPSLDEGFGLPAVEAMSCGTPVIVSRGHALEEVAAGAALLVDPLDEQNIAEAMQRVLRSPNLAEDLSRRSLARAADLSWRVSASRLIEIFEETAEGKCPG